MNKSTSTPAVTKDFSRNEGYLGHFIKPYLADRKDDYEFYPLHDPRVDNLEYQWRKVNKETFIAKKFGKFPRPQPELHIEDIRHKAIASALRNESTTLGGTAISSGGASVDVLRNLKRTDNNNNVFSPKSAERSGGSSPRVQKSNFENQKPSKDIYATRANLASSQKLDNFELAQMKLKDDTYYVPPGSKFQAPHPMSDTRSGFADDASIDWNRVRALRKMGGAVIPTSKSLTNIPVAADRSAACEFGSVKQLHKCRSKHMRSMKGPFDKFSGEMTLGSQAIGWAQDNPRVPVRYKGPDHGIADSQVTQYYHNMKMTNMEAILRYSG